MKMGLSVNADSPIKRQKLVCREETGVNQKMIWWKKKKLLLYLRQDLVQNRK